MSNKTMAAAPAANGYWAQHRWRPQGSAAPPAWLIPAVLGLAAAADWLFYGEYVGWTLGAFALVLLAVAVFANRDLLAQPLVWLVLALDAGLCLAMVEDPSALAAGLLIVGLLSFQALGVNGVLRSAATWIDGLIAAGVQGIFQGVNDAARLPSFVERFADRATLIAIIRSWVLPVAGGAVFLTLFAAANPVIGQWLDQIDIRRALAELPSEQRVMFWLASAAAIWWLLRARLEPSGQAPQAKLQAPIATSTNPDLVGWLFSRPAIIRSMFVFNAMFALQNGLDASYLWGHRALPPGFSFAAYAHRGAYPLMMTALLAAAFVLIAFRPASASETDRSARGLMYLWIAQNVVLVVSSIWRMVLYVEAYSLTHLRVAVLIWMGLVALGLILIVARFVFGRTNMWLVNANTLALLAVLYAAAFADIGGFIAGYNVSHSREVTGRGVHLDIAYLESIGPRALPAIRRFIEATTIQRRTIEVTPGSIRAVEVARVLVIPKLESQIASRLAGWRSWTYSLHRMALSILEQPGTSTPP